MTPQELAFVRAELFGRTWSPTFEGRSVTWTCDNLNWTGLRCAVALNDGAGQYRDMTLEAFDAAGVAAFVALIGTCLQAQFEAECEAAAAAIEFDDLIGEVL